MENQVYYGDYLALPTLLNSQKPKSAAHDEVLFIIIHQVYELWFKQILHELGSINAIMEKATMPENAISTITHRLDRITEIQKILNDQLKIIETMTPLDFMDFRDHLNPASGFQSIQFRLVEMKLGLKLSDRTHFAKAMFTVRLTPEDQKILNDEEKKLTLFDHLDSWLARFPLLNDPQFTFWEDFRKVVEAMLENDKKLILGNKSFTSEERDIQMMNHRATEKTFESLFNPAVHNELVQSGKRKLTLPALKTAIFISLYRDEPLLAGPFRVLTLLTEIDENFTTWRYKHAMMAHRLLGTKIGTGGSSGHEYLKKAADNNRAFIDLFNLATFIIPRSKLPKLSDEVRKKLNFRSI